MNNNGAELREEVDSTLRPVVRMCATCHENPAVKNWSNGSKYCSSCFKIKTREWGENYRRKNGIRPRSEYFSVQDGKRVCTDCKVLKAVSEFHRDRSGKRSGGILGRCKECEAKRCKAYEFKNRLERTLYRHGMTVVEYDMLLASQGGVCAVCKTDKNINGRGRFCVDHDHKTGQVRGLLCNSCNWGIGHFYDNTDLLLKAAQYLTSHRPSSPGDEVVAGVNQE